MLDLGVPKIMEVIVPSLIESITQLGAVFMSNQGDYSLTAEAMKLRGQRPLHCGDDYVFNWTYEDSDEAGIDISGYTILFTAKYAASDSTNIVQAAGSLVGGGTGGQFTVTIARTDVVGPEAVYGVYDIQLTDGSSNVETILHGDIEFLPSVS